MDADESSVDAQLLRLKTLARDLLASDTPELDVLEEMAGLAGDVARNWRSRARQQMFDQVMSAARDVFPDAGDFGPRLTDLPLEELSSLWALLDNAVDARTALARADDGLRSAHERGDYAAMAPLALEADTQKHAFARSSAAFTDRLGLGTALLSEVPAAIAPEAVSEHPEMSNVVLLPTEIVPLPTEIASAATEHEPAPAVGEVHHLDVHGEDDAGAAEGNHGDASALPRGERRRVRDLLRQMRSVPDEAS